MTQHFIAIARYRDTSDNGPAKRRTLTEVTTSHTGTSSLVQPCLPESNCL